MSDNNELHVVFGAGPLGLAVMRQLLAKGKRTWVVSSSGKVAVPSQVQVLRSDAADATSIAEICRWGAVIYNCAEVYFLDWEEYLPRIQAGLIEGAALGGGRIAGLIDPMVGETAAEVYRFETPFLVSHGKYERAFGNETTPHSVALRRTIEWFRGYVKQS